MNQGPEDPTDELGSETGATRPGGRAPKHLLRHHALVKHRSLRREYPVVFTFRVISVIRSLTA